jgi:hypothetical protein
MKYLILALLAATFSAFVATAEAGITIKCKPQASGDPLKGLNVSKGGGPNPKGGQLCANGGGDERDKLKGSTESVAPIRSTKSNASERSTTINSTKSNPFRFEEGGKNDGKSAPVGNSQQKYGIAVDDPGVPNDKPAPKK